MFSLEVANFMSKNCDEFLNRMLFDEGIKKNKSPQFSKACKKGVGFGGALRAVHRENAAQFEISGLSISFNSLPKRSWFKRSESVKEGH